MRSSYLVRRSILGQAVSVILATFPINKTASASDALAPEIWFAPPDNITQNNADFGDLFYKPELWKNAAKIAKVFSIPVNYLLNTPPETVQILLKNLKSAGLRLDVAIPGLPVDKHVCGDGIEGMIWPGEQVLFTSKLKELGADVYSFTFDLPLSSGHFSSQQQACRFSATEVAKRLAQTVVVLRHAYPNARLIDAEVPTGMPVATWTQTLSEWLADFQQATGEDIYGLTLDIWWKFDWKEAVSGTSEILKRNGIRMGIFIDASEGREFAADDWIKTAKRNACHVRALQVPVDYVVIANWRNMSVPNLPEKDSSSLASLLKWAGEKEACKPSP